MRTTMSMLRVGGHRDKKAGFQVFFFSSSSQEKRIEKARLIAVQELLDKYNISVKEKGVPLDATDLLLSPLLSILLKKSRLLSELRKILNSGIPPFGLGPQKDLTDDGNTFLLNLQTKLEATEEPLLSGAKTLTYTIKNSLLTSVKELSELLKPDDKNPLAHDYRRLAGKTVLKPFGKKRIDFYTKYNSILRAFSKSTESAALVLIVAFADAIRNSVEESFTPVTLPEFKEGVSLIEKTDLYNKKVRDSISSLRIERTKFLHTIGSKFMRNYRMVCNENAIRERLLEINRNLKKEDRLECLPREERVSASSNLEVIHLDSEELFMLSIQIEAMLSKLNIISIVSPKEMSSYLTPATGGRTTSVEELVKEEAEDANTILEDLKEESRAEVDTVSNNSNASSGTRRYYVSISGKIAESLFCLNYHCPSLPMVVRPEDWVNSAGAYIHEALSKEETPNESLNFGGFRCNRYKVFPGVHLKGEVSYSHVQEEAIRNINYLQSTPFYINPVTLQMLQENRTRFLSEFLVSKDLVLFDIFDHQDNKLFLRSFHDFRQKFYPMSGGSLLRLSEKDASIKSSLLNQAITQYNLHLSTIVSFIFTLEFAELFKEYTLYFKCFFDSRGRVYYQGYPLNPQGDILSKFLLDIRKYAPVNGLPPRLPDSSKDFFKRARANLGKNSYVAIDASCSGVSILSAIIGYKEGLLRTNVFYAASRGVSANRVPEKKEDYYSTVLNAVSEHLRLQTREFSRSDPTRARILEIVLSCLDRAFIKGWVMRYVYSEGAYSRYKALSLEYSNKREGISEFADTPFLKEEKSLLMSVARSFPTFMAIEINTAVEFIRGVFSEAFSKRRMCNTRNLEDSASFKEYPVLKICSRLDFKSFFSILPVTRTTKAKMTWYRKIVAAEESGGGIIQKKSQFVYNQETPHLDLQKLLRCIIPHFIHHMDSVLLNVVVSLCRAEDIPIFTAHDCFCCYPEDAEFVKSAYAKAFQEELLKRDPLRVLLEVNRIPITDEINSQLLAFSSAREQILREYDVGDLERSPWILTDL